MGKLSKRMKRLLAILLVEVIVASNVFVSYADENDDGIMYQISEEEIAEEIGDEEVVSSGEDEEYDDYSDDESGDEDYESDDEGDFSDEEYDSSEENNESEDPALTDDDENITEEEPDEEDGSESAECICDTKCTSDSYNVNCPVCIDAADAEDMNAFFEEHCKGEAAVEEEPDVEEEIEPEIVEIDNSVTVTAVCVADGEEIEGADSFEIKVDGTVDVFAKAPEIEGYTFADKAVIKDDGSDISKIMKETVEEKEKTEIDGKMEVTKITATTSMSYYDGTQWKELENDITVVFEYTQDEETDEEETTAVKFIASFVDQDGNAIEGYTNKTLTFDDTLDLTKAPVTIEAYEYIEAQIGDAVITSINKKTETDEEGEEVVTYSYTAEGEEVEVTEDTEVALVYEGGEAVVETVITLACVDEESLAIEGYEEVELPEFADELVLDDPEKAPIEIEGYEYKEAMIDGTVITSLVKEAAEEADAESEEVVSVYSYVTKDGETIAIEEDTVITLSYEEAEVAVALDATIVDEFGDEIDEKYTNMDISKIFDKEDELTLDDPENPPVKKVSVRQSLFKTIKYTYVKASVDNEIITGLKRKAIESEDAKASEEYAYSYTTDGETWKKIKEDTTVIFEYSDGKKTTYTYEDSFVSVTATLQHANAIPDDAEFVVTPVTSNTSGYNYDAYMEALNKNADQIGDSTESSDKDAKKYTEDNTLLYDIAFLAEPVDEDGNTIEGSKVEYQPAEGMVKISFTFKQKQLEEDLNAEKAGDVTVVHMPLTDAVKESVDTTADATGISASDVNLEVVSGESTSIAAEQVDFSLSDFSLIGFVGVESQLDLKPGTTYTYRDILGNAIYYGITANTINSTGHMDSNYATKMLKSNGQYITLGAFTGDNNPGIVVVGDIQDSLHIDQGSYVSVWCTADDADKIVGNGEKIIASKSSLDAYVDSLINHVSSMSSKLFDQESYKYSKGDDQNNREIDISKLDDGTYYFNMDSFFAANEGPGQGLNITKKSTQTVVFNTSNAKVNLKQFKIKNADTGEEASSATSNASMDSFAQTIVFNMPNAVSVQIESGVVGIFIAPKASININSTSSGWLIVDKVFSNGGEWHCVWGEMPDSSLIPVPAGFTATKTINNEIPNNETFTFVMEELGEGNDYHVEVENNGSMISFPNITYNEAGIHYYRVYEKGDGASVYQYDKTQYIVKVEVSALSEGQIGGNTVTTCKIDSITYYKVVGENDADESDAIDGNIASGMSFNNIKEEKGSIEVRKVVNGFSTTDPFYFVLTDSNGKRVTKEDGTDVYEITANTPVTIEGLAIGTYYLKETNAAGVEVSASASKEFPYVVTYSSNQIDVKVAATTEFTITNTYEKYETEGSLPLAAHKSYNRSLIGNDFHFVVTENGKTILEADNDSQGNINFGSISYKGLDAEGTHIYEIREQEGDKAGIAYSETVYTLTVDVKDNGQHQLIPTIVSLVDQEGNNVTPDKIEFKNEYKAAGKLELKASKTVDEKTPADDEVFDFELWKATESGSPVVLIDKKNNTGEDIIFEAITYDQTSIGTYYYLVKETGAKAGYELDKKQYLVKVIISDNDLDGELEFVEEYFIFSDEGNTTAAESIAFDNSYKPAEDSIVLRATKLLKNGNISKYIGKFSFTLQGPKVKGGEETVFNTGENGTDVVFSEIKYGKEDIGENYIYTITENASNLGSVVTNDPISVRTVIVEVRADRNTGEVIATPRYQTVEGYATDNDAVFHNEYHTSGSVTLEGSKVLTGKDLTKEMFSFVVKEGDETVATGKNNQDGTITFTEISYDKAGMHVYTVSEVIPPAAKENNNVLNGITYDTTSYQVTVTLTDDEQGNLIPTVEYPDNGITFENKYDVMPVEITLEGTKKLTGRDMTEGEFTFEVVEKVGETENVVATGTNAAAVNGADGKINFNSIEYKEAGNHVYTVREKAGSLGGVGYDTTTFEVRVNVTDNGRGGLEASVEYTSGKIKFNNQYTANGEVTLRAHKTVDGVAPSEPDEIFTFEVLENGEVIRTADNGAEGDVEFEAIKYTLNDVKEHTYVIRETITDKEGYSRDVTEYTVTVKVSDPGTGTLNVSEPLYKKGETPIEEEAVVFNNIKDGSTVIEASKELLGGGLLTDGMFTFTLSSTEHPNFATQETKNTGTKVVFDPIKYTRNDIGETYTYTITEKPSELSYVTDDPVRTRTVKVTVNEMAGKIDPVVEYQPVEQYLDDVGAVFHNTYSAKGYDTISGTKELTGRDIKNGEFTFELYSVDANNAETLVSEATNTVNGGEGFSFAQLEFTSIGTYVYRVKEKSGTAGGVTYTEDTFDVTIVVTDNQDGTLATEVKYPEGGVVFKNNYIPAKTSITLDGMKELTGRSLENEEFEFEVKDVDGTVVSTGKNDADGKINFSPIEYTQAGIYEYVVSEKKPEGHVNNVSQGVTYDSGTFNVTVEVEDDAEGELHAAVSQSSPAIKFTNIYAASKDFTLSASKTVDNRSPKEGEVFTFTLTGGYGDKQENQTDVANSGETINFNPIHYDQADIGKTFTYIVRESQEGLSGYQYDKRVYTVEVTITDDDRDGELEISPVYTVNEQSVDSIQFNNDYTPTEGEVTLNASKMLENGTLGNGDFWFTLTSSDHEGFIEQSVSNVGTEIKFAPIPYKKDDIGKTYHYVIKEEGPDNGIQNGVTYDTARERHVTVEVKAENGQIVATETYEVCDEHMDDGNAAIFHNSYNATGGFTPKANKTLTGRDMNAGEFWFVLKEGETVLQRVSNSVAKDGEAGTINFTEIPYTLADVNVTHHYIVEELDVGAGVTPGGERYEIEVLVEDDGEGNLVPKVTYSPEVIDETMTFTNTYNATGEFTPSGTKTLTGRNMEAGEFNFVVMEGGTQVATGTNTAAENGKESAITFTTINYGLDDIGPHTYIITEVDDNLPAGVAENSQSFTVVVDVRDDGHGNLTAQIVSEEPQAVAFENTYAAKTSLKLEAVKTVNGNVPTEDEVFTFTLTGGLGDKTVNQSIKNDGDSIEFTPIDYDQDDVGKTFIYKVEESGKNVKKGYTYDKTMYTVEVTVNRDDSAEGGLSLSKVIKVGDTTLTDQTVKFNNTYPEAGQVQLVAQKDLKNGTLIDGMFSFTLTGPKLPEAGWTVSNVGTTVTFDVIPYDESDVGENYVYTITEVNDHKPGVGYDKELTRTVTVQVREKNGVVIATPVYSSENYKDDNDKNMAIFHNTYSATGVLNLTATKKLNGRELTDTDKYDFVVIDTATNEVVSRAENVGESITFPTITYTEKDVVNGSKTFNYEIKELSYNAGGVVSDNTIYSLEVTVSDNGNGTLKVDYELPAGGYVFTNTYTAKDGEITFAGTKGMIGRELTDNDHFQFEVYEVVNGQEEASPVTTGSSVGSEITFGKIMYGSLDDVGTHTYHVKEVEFDQNGVKSTNVVRTVKVVVSDHGNGKLNAVLSEDSDELTFTNEYHSTGELQLEAWKTVNGAVPGDRVFSFTLSNDKDSITDTKSNTADGHVLFDKITFTEKDVANSPITYTIKENIPTGDSAIEGMVYDGSVYTVTVTLTDDGKGNITVNSETIKYVKDGQELDKASFDNTYEADGQVVIEASKRLNGGTLRDDQFTFILKDENGNEVDRVTNNGTKVTFKEISYTLDDVGSHTYTIEEYNAGVPGYTYDGTKFTVNVNVVDNGPGELSVTKEYVGVDGIPEFVNEYKPKEIWISKVDAVSSNELAGASMTISSDGEVLDAWVSDGGRHEFKADYGKTYTLTETAAPNGFLIAESITFRIDSDGMLWIMQADGNYVQQADSVVTMVDEAAPTPTPTPTPNDEPTPTPGNGPTPTPGGGDEPTPTPGENPTPGTQITPPPGNGPTPTSGDEDVLGARRGEGAVLGARRAPKTAVLGARRRPATGDTIALFIWIMVLSLSAGGAVVSSTMLKYNGKKRKR